MFLWIVVSAMFRFTPQWTRIEEFEIFLEDLEDFRSMLPVSKV